MTTIFDVLKTAPNGPFVRATDPGTAQAPKQATLTAGRIAALIAHYNHPSGLTDFELADLTQIKQTSIGKRRGELCGVVAGEQVGPALIVSTGNRRLNRDGNRSLVWQITAEGIQIARAYLETQAAA